MRSIDPEKAPRRSKTNILLTDKDWRLLLDGGTKELANGVDFEGSPAAAREQIRDILTEKLGTWTVAADQKNGIVTVTITRPIG